MSAADAQLKDAAKVFLRDTTRTDLLQNIITQGFERQQFIFLETFLNALLKKVGKNTDLYWLLFQALEAQNTAQARIKAAGCLKQLFQMPNAKTQDMYASILPYLAYSGNKADLNVAIKLLRDGIAQIPDSAKIRRDLAEALQQDNRSDEAETLLDEAIAQLGEHPDLVFDRSLLVLKRSHLRAGLGEYARRFEAGAFKDVTLEAPWPRWQGEPLAGKSIYLWAEQGVGDIVMWAGLLPYLLQQNCKITLAMYPKMQALMKRSFPDIEVVDRVDNVGDAMRERQMDYHAPIGDVMVYCLPEYTPSAHPAFLKADSQLAAKLRQRYLEKSESKATRLIGISWATAAKTFSRRDIPLPLFWRFAHDADVQLVSLQYDGRSKDLAEFTKQTGVTVIQDHAIDAVEHCDGWAAQIAAMDEVITIQNATAHFAGALGVKTTLLLSSFGCWRWGMEGKNHWYDSVEIIRQKSGDPWKSVLANLDAL